MAFNFDQYNALPDNQNWQAAFNPPKIVAPQKKKKDFWTDQISTGGSLAGALAGGAAGTAILPGVGTLIGALLGGAAGGAGGQVAENAISGDNLGQDVASEALWGGATALPFGAVGKLAKAGGTLVKGLGSEAARTAAKDLVTEAGVKTMTPKAVQALSISDALKNAPAQAAVERLASQTTLSQKLGDKLSGAANDLAIKQFRLTPSQLANFKTKFGEDAGQTIRKYGFNSAEDITAKGINPLQDQFSSLVNNAGNISKDTLKNNFTNTISKLKSANSSTNRAIGDQLQTEVDGLLAKYGKEIPATSLNDIRREFDSLVNYTNKAADPNKYGVNKRVADVLRKTLQEADSTGQLKGVGQEISKLRQLSDNVAKQGELGRGSLPLNVTSLLGAGAGGIAGGLPGALSTMALTNAVNSPTGRNLIMGAVDKTVGKLSTPTKKSIGQTLKQAASRIGGVGATKSVINDQLTSQSPSDLNMMADTTPTSTMSTPTISPANINSIYQQTQQMSSEPSIGGYSKSQIENAMAAAMIDGNSKAFTQLKGLYDLLPAQSSSPYGDLSQSSQNALASSDNAINTVDQLQQLYSNAGGARGRLGGLIGNFAADAGLDSNAKSYNSLSQASVTQIAKALAGAGAGTVSDMDAKVIIAALPTLQDTPEEAAIKFAALRQRLDAARQNTLMYGSGGRQSSSNLASALQG